MFQDQSILYSDLSTKSIPGNVFNKPSLANETTHHLCTIVVMTKKCNNHISCFQNEVHHLLAINILRSSIKFIKFISVFFSYHNEQSSYQLDLYIDFLIMK